MRRRFGFRMRLWLGGSLLLRFGLRLMVTATAAATTTTTVVSAIVVSAVLLEISRIFNAFDGTNTGRGTGSGCASDGKSKENGGDEIHFGE